MFPQVRGVDLGMPVGQNSCETFHKKGLEMTERKPIPGAGRPADEL
jgi:hypothetical protein